MTWNVPVVYEDNHLLVVNKPAGLLAQGDSSGDPSLLDVAREYLRSRYDKPGHVYLGLVHRLDRNVSGVMVLARTSKAAGRLSRQFREGTVDKTYLAVLCGRPAEAAGELRSWLSAKGDKGGVTRAEHEEFADSRESLLRYVTIDSRTTTSEGSVRFSTLVEVKPVTGRRHQIRAQFALAGCPLLGDVKYGAPAGLADHRIALHANRLDLAHPVGGRPVSWSVECPHEWPWPPAGRTRS